MLPSCFFPLAIAVSIAATFPGILPAEQVPAPPFNPTLPWLSDLDEALATSKVSGKPVLAAFR